jgi:uncharacterized protein (TIGR02145 family)
MNRYARISALFVLSCLPSLAAVSGTVTDRAGHGLAGVGVELVSTGASTTTDDKGAWSLGTTGIDAQAVARHSARWTGNTVELSLTEPSNVSVEAFDIKGALLRRMTGLRLGAGAHCLPFALNAHRLAWLRLTVNGKTGTKSAELAGKSVVAAQIQFAARQLGVVDTIRFNWKTKMEVRIPLSSPDTSGILLQIDTVNVGWNETIHYGSLYDFRDGQAYRTVKIGEQTWMAENLNFPGANGSLGVYSGKSGDPYLKFGRLYTWLDAMQRASTSASNPSGVKGLCPTGWHVPSDSEWTTLDNHVDATGLTNGTRLKATMGWDNFGNGTDDYGFRAFPGGVFWGIHSNTWAPSDTG